MSLRRCLFGLLLSSVAIATGIACSDGSEADTPGGTSDTDAAPTPTPTPTPTAKPDASPLPDGSAPTKVTFSYKPTWAGVKSVEVVGAFGLATDWAQPFLTLTDDGTGTFTGVAPALANGHYAYLFRVVGDSAAASAKAATYARFAIDPKDPAFVACPTAAPTYTTQAANPCSDLTVPVTPAAAFHVRGVVRSGGAPIGGYLVAIERNEKASHHMFADRATTLADGTFDLVVAPGTYRLEVQHPTFLSMTDVQRAAPETYAAVRRSLSTPFLVDADEQINAAEIAYDGYASMEPRGATTLPTTFTFAVPPKTQVRAAIYPARQQVADPIWVAPFGKATSDVFDGGFNTSKADGGIVPDASYLWGTESTMPSPDGGAVTWTAQSMVYPVKW